ncbi:outer membrane protein [Jannaschia sp. KMU-145]|uniref:outer membrane protein n=1 Tax=Jannaschia halovivens TaxID=3388667 RepID=UPI00396AF6D9
MGHFRRRRCAFLFCSVLVALSAQASAQSLSDWSGSYAGVVFGFGSAGATGIQDCCGFDPGDDPDNLSPDGMLGGVQLGFDRQHGRLVYGVVADAVLANVSASQNSQSEAIPNQSDIKIDGMLSLRARAGYSIGDVLPYATLGVGYVSANYSMRDPDGADPFGQVSLDGFGPVFGAGVSWLASEDTSITFEVLHYQPNGRVGTAGLTSDSNPEDFVAIDGVTTVRVGAMLRF